jgi:ribonuclease HII
VILAGVDEAGYGPLLGPLCTGLAAFRVEGAADAPAAEEAVRGALRAAGGVRVDDSKRVHRPSKGPGPLEREVLAVLAARDGAVPRDGASLVRALGSALPPGDHPWYGGIARRPIPLAADAADAEARGRALARALRESGVVLAVLEARALPEGRYNEAVAREGSKAAVLFGEAAALLGRAAAEASAGEPCEAVVDRHGARARYAPLLRARFPERRIRVEREVRGASSYLAGTEEAPVRVRFEEKADGTSVAAGLASMTAKYLREVLVATLNDFVLREAPGVRRTAGYWTDGLRFLRETEAARRRLGVDDGLFVRCR